MSSFMAVVALLIESRTQSAQKLVSFISSSFQQQMTHIFKRNSTGGCYICSVFGPTGAIFSWVASCIILSFILGEYISYESFNDELSYYMLGTVY